MTKTVPTTIPVPLGERSYTIRIEPGSVSQFQWPDEWTGRYARGIIVSDTNVADRYLTALKRRLKKSIPDLGTVVCPPGERTKSVEIAQRVWQKMVAQGADRETVVLALGGGVIGDLAGFVAATYMRGLDWLQIPTTLLAQVDSSVGGKVGINLAEGKNLIGAFWQPRGVLIDPEVLATLSEREYRAGLAEVIKYGAIADAKFLEYLEDHVLGIAARDPTVMTAVIARCCQLKAEVVADDERELTGRRAILNFGHTYGHALERVVGYGKILHGEAVAIGMLCAARLAHRAGRLTAEDVQRLAQLLQTLGLPTSVPAVSPQEVMAAMQSDKKKRDSQVQLILPNRWGDVQMVPWPGDDWVLESMRG